jgi:hypothetical protein
MSSQYTKEKRGKKRNAAVHYKTTAASNPPLIFLFYHDYLCKRKEKIQFYGQKAK